MNPSCPQLLLLLAGAWVEVGDPCVVVSDAAVVVPCEVVMVVVLEGEEVGAWLVVVVEVVCGGGAGVVDVLMGCV